MRKVLAALAIVLFVGAGCNSTKPIDTSMQVPVPPFKSEIPAQGQTEWVSFLIGYGYTGGMGSMPVLLEDGTPRTVALAPVYFDETHQAEVAAKLPKCYSGTPRIEVRALAALEKRRDINQSYPDAPEETYYVVVPEKIDHITVIAEACKE